MPSSSSHYSFIAREAWVYLIALLVLAIFCQFFIGPLASIPCGLLLLGGMYLFRDPARTIPSQPLAVLSPVYGIVTLIEEAEEVRLHTRAMRIQIHTRIHDIYSLCSPVEGKVIQHWCSAPDSKEPRRHFDFLIRSDEGDNVVTAIRLRDLISSFHVYLHSGERVGHGQRCGYIFFGGIIDIFLPVECKIHVEAGQIVKSGSTILAQLIHS